MNSDVRLCIDIDNVVAKTDEVMRAVIAECTSGRVNLAYEDVVEFDYCLCKDAAVNFITKDEWKLIHHRFSNPDRILSITPFPAIQNHLAGLVPGFEIHFATARLARARRPTVEWLESYGFPEHSLHFLNHAQKHRSLAGLYAAVEDDYAQAVAFVQSGTRCFLIEHPWNRTKPPVKGIAWVKGWPELIAQLNHITQ